MKLKTERIKQKNKCCTKKLLYKTINQRNIYQNKNIEKSNCKL